MKQKILSVEVVNKENEIIFERKDITMQSYMAVIELYHAVADAIVLRFDELEVPAAGK